MPAKPRRVKSVQTFQHEDNKKSQWDSDSEDESADQSKDSPPIFTLPNGYSVRQMRRTDAPAIQAICNDRQLLYSYQQSYYHQPFSLWAAHKLIDELRGDDGWGRRRFYPVQDGESEESRQKRATEIYERARTVMHGRNLDARIEDGALDAGRIKPSSEATKSGHEPKKKEDKQPKNDTAFTIASPDDKLVGLIDLTLGEPPPPSAPTYAAEVGSSNGSNYFSPTTLHIAEVTYILSRDERGKGLMTDILREFVAWSWRNFAHLECLTASVSLSWNPASSRVLEKNGFRRVGVWTDFVRKGGRFGDWEELALMRPGSRRPN